jgi:hypothetical protein
VSLVKATAADVMQKLGKEVPYKVNRALSNTRVKLRPLQLCSAAWLGPAQLRCMLWCGPSEVLPTTPLPIPPACGLSLQVGTMIEIPRGALRAGDLARTAEFFSFGTNDLTQTCMGISRDDAQAKFLAHYMKVGRRGVGRVAGSMDKALLALSCVVLVAQGAMGRADGVALSRQQGCWHTKVADRSWLVARAGRPRGPRLLCCSGQPHQTCSLSPSLPSQKTDWHPGGGPL